MTKTQERLQTDTQMMERLSQIAKTIDELKGQETVVLNVQEFLIPTSYMVITSANNSKQLRGMREAVEHCLDIKAINYEGQDSKQWTVVDFGSIIVHVMSEEARSFYELDELWEGNTVELS